MIYDQQVFVAQKRLIRALAGERYWRSTTPLCSARPLFSKFDLLPFYSIYVYESCKFVKKYPGYFQKTRDVHGHDTRGKPELYIPVQTSQLSKQNPLTCVANVYNALPLSLRLEPQFKEFSTTLKHFLYHREFYCADEYFEFLQAYYRNDQVDFYYWILLNTISEIFFRDDLSPEEYNESKQDTTEQLKELHETLEKLIAGDMTLVDGFGEIQLSIKEAILKACPSSALKEQRKEKTDLRSRLTALEKDVKNGRITENESHLLKEEILQAIIQSGETITSEEKKFLSQLSARSSHFVEVTENSGLSEQAIKSASSSLYSFQK